MKNWNDQHFHPLAPNVNAGDYLQEFYKGSSMQISTVVLRYFACASFVDF